MQILRNLGAVVMLLSGCGEVHDIPDAPIRVDAMPDSGSVCTANANSCGASDALFMCDGAGVQLTKVQDCQYGCSTDRCNACAANSTFCSGDDLVRCSASGGISNPMACQFGCQASACNTCMPNTRYCANTTAVTCTAGGQPGTMRDCGAAGCQSGVCNTCTPNTTTCADDSLVVCNAGGTVASATTCALGCSTTGPARCQALVPAFGVPAPSGALPDLTLTDNATLDITNCAALDVKLTIGTVTTTVPAAQLAQVSQASVGGPPICIVKYGAITIPDTFGLNIVNSATPGHVLSLQSTGPIDIRGGIGFGSSAPGPSPGTNSNKVSTNASGKYTAAGPGGAGGVRAGGSGGKCTMCDSNADVVGGAGGAAFTLGNILRNGSAGGNTMLGSTILAAGGRGGGGLHLVSLTRVTLAASAAINVNGGGGSGPSLQTGSNTAGGGGAGGTVVIEAPTINVSAGALAVANGAGGAAGQSWYTNLGGLPQFGHYMGEPGQRSTTRAAGGDIPNTTAGDGGYEADGTASPSENGSPSDVGAATQNGGGGGGSRGFIVLRARAMANVMISFGAVISPAPSLQALTSQ